MSDPQESGGSKPLSEWTLVNSQGEIMSEDVDSESSDSSIEVVNVEGDDIVSCRLQRGRSLEQDVVVVAEDAPSACLTSEETPTSRRVEDVSEVKTILSPVVATRESMNAAAVSDLHVEENDFPGFPQTDVTSSQRTDISHMHSGDSETVEDVKDVRLYDNETAVHVTAELAHNSEGNDDKHAQAEVDEGVVTDASNISSNKEQFSEDGSVELLHNDGEFNIETSEREETHEEGNGACCVELLMSNSGVGGLDNVLQATDDGNQRSLSPTPMSFEDIQVSGDGVAHSRTSSRSDSDTDSDFVRLDSDSIDNIDAFVEEHVRGEERVVIPLKLYRTGSSIGPSFSFMRNEEPSNDDSPNQGFVDREDEDRDDDTESSTELDEGVDDRIESEQSEAGSLSAQNDIGDLSVFADIGDLPLEAGDVPRNYIHRPNNHLSTVLNIIVVLAAILTMGISLGIIMATDLEIEEWQNAHEFQVKRVNQLEAQLSEMKSDAEAYKRILKSVAEDGIYACTDRKSERYLHEHTSVGRVFRDAADKFWDCRRWPGGLGTSCNRRMQPYVETYHPLFNRTQIDLEDGPIEYEPSHEELFARHMWNLTKTLSPAQRPRQDADGLKGKEKFQASPVVMDIQRLQQSLTLEQERALHWQQLYLMERRQREKERENEEWEDEREREMWEKEKERMDELECLKKLMSTNLTTLTQHVTRWNVSVFDDFANLSMLMSGVAELKQSVVDSVHRVWQSAEELIDNMHAKEEKQNEANQKDSVPKREVLSEYLSLYLDHIKRNFLPDKEILVEHLSRILDDIRQGVEDVFSEVYMIDSVRKIWEDAEEMIKAHFRNEKDAEGQGRTVSLPEKEVIIDYLAKMLNDIQLRFGDFVDDAQQQEDQSRTDRAEQEVKEQESTHDSKKASDEDKDHDIPPIADEPFFEEENSRHGFWSRKIGKVLKKTGRTVRKLGRKVVSTWDKVKTIWHERKPFIFNIAEHFTAKVMKVSTKFTKMCLKVRHKLFRNGEEEMAKGTDIHSSCVQEARKQWQHQVMHDPCKALGKFSYECNSGKKKCKKNLKKMSDTLSQLLIVPTVEPKQLLTWRPEDVELVRDQFKSFQRQWGKSKLLLKTDIGWVDCQTWWWSFAVDAMHNGHLDKLAINHCDSIDLEDNFCDGQCEDSYAPNSEFTEKYAKSDQKHVDDDDDEHVYGKDNTAFRDDEEDDDDDDDDGKVEEEYHDERRSHEHDAEEGNDYILDDEVNEVNDTANDHDSDDWYLERARYRLELRREKERADWLFEMAEDREQQRNKQWNDGDEHQTLWLFEKAKDREEQRKEDHRTDWVFERADDRKASFTRKWAEGSERGFKHTRHSEDKERPEKSGKWYTDQAEERQKQRDDEHQSDWVFERASDRRQGHKHRHHSKSYHHHHGQAGHGKHCKHAQHKASAHGKHFRSTYGKVVSSP